VRTLGKQLAVGVILASVGFMAFVPISRLSLQPESRIWVKGTSTVRDYTCSARTIAADVVTSESAEPALPLDRLVQRAEVTVAIAGIDCGNGTMNDHMRKALRITDHPQVSFQLENYAIENDNALRLTGILTMAGRALPVEFTGTVTEREDGMVRVEATRQIRMTEWGIKPPTLMLGTLKVHDPVTIGVDLLLKRP
jgi:hypothetical protein